MFSIKLPQLANSAKLFILGFMIVVGCGYVLALLNVKYNVGLSVKDVVHHYHPVAAANDEFGEAPEGPSFPSMVSTLHFHLIAHGTLFFCIGLIILMFDIGERWRTFLLLFPFVSMIIDNGGMLLTRFVSPGFAIFVVLGGMFMAMSYASTCAIAFHQMFLKKSK